MKRLAATVLHMLAFASGVSARKAQALNVGRILCLHGVGDKTYPVKNFELHLGWLTRHFSIVSLASLLERMNSPRGLRNEIVLTFDDGLRNNFTKAYPLLKKLNLPATFFVCPGLIENGRWLWTHEARARLAALPTDQRGRLFDDNPNASDEQILERMKGFSLKERYVVDEKLRRLTAGFAPTPVQHNRYDLMGWDDIRQLDPVLVTIGSHSLTHPILSSLTGPELTVEIAESRRILENKLQRPVQFFCYPNGSHNPEVLRLTAENYRAALSTGAGFVQNDSPRHQLPRIGIAASLSYLAWRLHRPGA